MPLAPDLPALELHHLESPSPRTLLGSKGGGEAGTIGAFGVKPNAVTDALSTLAVELNQVPRSRTESSRRSSGSDADPVAAHHLPRG